VNEAERMGGHVEIPVKVNAWVDRGVEPLVSALNGYACVFTADSCEGDNERGAYVLFSYRGNGRTAARFAADLGAALAPLTPEFLLQAEWRPNGEGEPLLALTCPREHVHRVAEALETCRRTVCGDGN